MTTIFAKDFQVGWGDLDSNGHMKNTAYLDAAATTRFSFFQANGFSVSRFHEMQFGPVVFKDEIQFFKEMRLLDKFRVSFELDGLSPDGRIMRLMNIVLNEQGERSAIVTTHGAWFDLQKRKVVAPPIELLQVMQQLSKTSSFQEIVKDSRS